MGEWWKNEREKEREKEKEGDREGEGEGVGLRGVFWWGKGKRFCKKILKEFLKDLRRGEEEREMERERIVKLQLVDCLVGLKEFGEAKRELEGVEGGEAEGGGRRKEIDKLVQVKKIMVEVVLNNKEKGC